MLRNQVHRIIVGELETNCYLLWDRRDSALIIDPGAEGEKIEDEIISLALEPAAVILTHGHYDHIGAANFIAEAFSIPIFADEDEMEMLKNPEKNFSAFVGEPVVINVIRYGEPLIDFGGFFTPLKVLLQRGKIKPTPEAIYVALRRSPAHMARSKSSMLAAIEGLYWACVDSAHAALMAAGKTPPSPEHIAIMLYETFVREKKLKKFYVLLYRDLYTLMHKILHGDIKSLKGTTVDAYINRVDMFIREMARLVKELEK